MLDARDPLSTKLSFMESKIKSKKSLYVLNKIDLCPVWVTKKWINYLSKEKPTIAFKSDKDKPFGKENLFEVIN